MANDLVLDEKGTKSDDVAGIAVDDIAGTGLALGDALGVRTCFVGGRTEGELRIDVSPADGSLWVTDSAKIVWTTNTMVCMFASANAGVGANQCKLADAQCFDGSTQPSGQFGGVGGAAVSNDGVAWAMDADHSYAGLSNASHAARKTNSLRIRTSTIKHKVGKVNE